MLLPFVERASCRFFEVSICSLEGRGGIGGGVFLDVVVLGGGGVIDGPIMGLHISNMGRDVVADSGVCG